MNGIEKNSVILQKFMKGRLRSSVGIMFAAVFLLPFALCVKDYAPIRSFVGETIVVSMATCESDGAFCKAEIDSPIDSPLKAPRGNNRWAIPTSSLTNAGTIGRIYSSDDVSQRLYRAYADPSINGLDCIQRVSGKLFQTVSSKRFSVGYYIYQRCQMRC